jgi:hypothetical protein
MKQYTEKDLLQKRYSFNCIIGFDFHIVEK